MACSRQIGDELATRPRTAVSHAVYPDFGRQRCGSPKEIEAAVRAWTDREVIDRIEHTPPRKVSRPQMRAVGPDQRDGIVSLKQRRIDMGQPIAQAALASEQPGEAFPSRAGEPLALRNSPVRRQAPALLRGDVRGGGRHSGYGEHRVLVDRARLGNADLRRQPRLHRRQFRCLHKDRQGARAHQTRRSAKIWRIHRRWCSHTTLSQPILSYLRALVETPAPTQPSGTP